MKRLRKLLPLAFLASVALVPSAQGHITSDPNVEIQKAYTAARHYCRTTYSGTPLYSCYFYASGQYRSYTTHTIEYWITYREGQNWGQGWFFYWCRAHLFYTHGVRRPEMEYYECN